jgi:hypothetical protein
MELSSYVKFELESSLAENMESQPNSVKLEYGSGYPLIWMSDRHTTLMLRQEFCALVENDWSVYPSISHRRLTDATVVHRTVTDFHEIEGSVANDLMFDLPERYQEDAGRGTGINLRSDPLRLLDYWAQAGQTALVGVLAAYDNRQDR